MTDRRPVLEQQCFELKMKRIEVERKIAMLRHEIDTAKRSFAKGGRAMDHVQLGNKERHLRALGSEVQEIQLQLAELKRSKHVDLKAQFPETFLAAAREVLSPEDFERVAKHAREVVLPRLVRS